MKICAFIQMYNEVEKGNLVRCLNNVKQWADEIVIYDDASTDDSVKVAQQYTSYVIQGGENCINRELFHKQDLLDLALTLNPDWIMWIDCDETLDRQGTVGGLRALAESSTSDAHSFHEVNLWISQTYARIDSLFDKGWFCRLWRVVDGLRFDTQVGVHLRLYPITIKDIERSEINVLHYGFWDYPKMLVKIGANLWDKTDFLTKAEDNWILNETECTCYKVPDQIYPVENVPEPLWDEPKPLTIQELRTYKEILNGS